MIEDDDKTEEQAEAELKNRKSSSSQAAWSIADDQNSFCKTLGDANLVNASNLVTRQCETPGLKSVSQKKKWLIILL